jgi:hypothetical protein
MFENELDLGYAVMDGVEAIIQLKIGRQNVSRSSRLILNLALNS